MAGSNNIEWKDLMDLHFDRRARDFLHTSFPAIVTRVNSNNTVDVQPLVSTLRPDGSNYPYGELFDVRMHTYGIDGDIFISIPIKVGMNVWVFVSERDIANVMKSDGTKPLNSTTQRTHDLSDCFCIPTFYPDKKAKEFDKEAIVIANGNTSITIKDGEVIINTDNASINASEVSITADNMVINATLHVDGDFSVNGSVEATGDTFTHNNINIGSTHTHTGVTTGGGTSGTPTP